MFLKELFKYTPIKIDFGGGENPRKKNEQYKTCDILGGVDYPHIDFNVDRLPFADSFVDEAICVHTLEHVREVKWFLNELHRVLKQEATIEFIVPYGLWSGSFKPVHHQQITPAWFDFLRKKASKRIYGFATWEILELEEVQNGQGEVYELRCVMRPVKS